MGYRYVVNGSLYGDYFSGYCPRKTGDFVDSEIAPYLSDGFTPFTVGSEIEFPY